MAKQCLRIKFQMESEMIFEKKMSYLEALNQKDTNYLYRICCRTCELNLNEKCYIALEKAI